MGMRVARLLVASFGAAAALAGDADPLADARRELLGLEAVEGAAVGEGGDPGRFHTLARVFLARGDRKLFATLTQDPHPVTRAMGLYALARTDPGAAAPLRRHLGDRGRFDYFPGGCCGSTSTVGSFARDLLLDTSCLGDPEGRPLVAPADRLAFELEVLSRNECSDLHDAAAGSVVDLAPPFELAALRGRCPGLAPWQILKGLGRTDPRPELRALLAACLGDPGLDDAARRAAASALTRDPDAAALAALRAFGDPLFVRAAELRQAHAARMAPLKAEQTWQGMEAKKPAVVAALTADHPLALPDLESSLTLAILDHEDVRQALVGSLERIAARASEFDEPWDTYGDLRPRLERIVLFPRHVEPAERDRILALVR
jgi:hypothetical protein